METHTVSIGQVTELSCVQNVRHGEIAQWHAPEPCSLASGRGLCCLSNRLVYRCVICIMLLERPCHFHSVALPWTPAR